MQLSPGAYTKELPLVKAAIFLRPERNGAYMRCWWSFWSLEISFAPPPYNFCTTISAFVFLRFETESRISPQLKAITTGA